MRAAELIGCEVFDAEGAEVGAVHDLRFRVVPGPGGDMVCRLDALECGGVGVGHRLGYGHGSMHGPWPFPALFRALADRSTVVEWAQVASLERSRIELNVSRGQLTTVRAERERGERQ